MVDLEGAQVGDSHAEHEPLLFWTHFQQRVKYMVLPVLIFTTAMLCYVKANFPGKTIQACMISSAATMAFCLFITMFLFGIYQRAVRFVCSSLCSYLGYTNAREKTRGKKTSEGYECEFIHIGIYVLGYILNSHMYRDITHPHS